MLSHLISTGTRANLGGKSVHSHGRRTCAINHAVDHIRKPGVQFWEKKSFPDRIRNRTALAREMPPVDGTE